MASSVSSPTGALTIAGLPYTAWATSSIPLTISGFDYTKGAIYTVVGYINAGTSVIKVINAYSGGFADDLANRIKANSWIIVGGSFIV